MFTTGKILPLVPWGKLSTSENLVGLGLCLSRERAIHLTWVNEEGRFRDKEVSLQEGKKNKNQLKDEELESLLYLEIFRNLDTGRVGHGCDLGNILDSQGDGVRSFEV